MDINIILNNLKKQIAENGYCENLGQKELAKYKSYIFKKESYEIANKKYFEFNQQIESL